MWDGWQMSLTPVTGTASLVSANIGSQYEAIGEKRPRGIKAMVVLLIWLECARGAALSKPMSSKPLTWSVFWEAPAELLSPNAPRCRYYRSWGSRIERRCRSLCSRGDVGFRGIGKQLVWVRLGIEAKLVEDCNNGRLGMPYLYRGNCRNLRVRRILWWY